MFEIWFHDLHYHRIEYKKYTERAIVLFSILWTRVTFSLFQVSHFCYSLFSPSLVESSCISDLFQSTVISGHLHSLTSFECRTVVTSYPPHVGYFSPSIYTLLPSPAIANANLSRLLSCFLGKVFLDDFNVLKNSQDGVTSRRNPAALSIYRLFMKTGLSSRTVSVMSYIGKLYPWFLGSLVGIGYIVARTREHTVQQCMDNPHPILYSLVYIRFLASFTVCSLFCCFILMKILPFAKRTLFHLLDYFPV